MARDVQSEFGRSWYSGMTALPEPRAALNFDLDVDVCVIGGGLAGLTVTRELVRRGWSVALVEARRVAWNASGRNAGFVVPGFAARIEKIVERIGLAAAKALWNLSEAGVQHVRDTLAELWMTEEGRGWLDVSTSPAADAALARVGLLGQEFGAEIEGWPAERVREVLKTRHYFHAIYFPRAFQINPLAYALALAAAAERAGAHIFEQTPALAIDPAGVRKRVTTPRAKLRAGFVVLAGNVHLGDVSRHVGDTLIPVSAYGGVTGPLGRRLATAIAFTGGVSDQQAPDHRYRVVGGDRLLWCGGPLFGYGGVPLKRRFDREIRAIYPQLGPVEFESLWRGDLGIAVHHMPQIGEVQPGVWLASGLGGQGLNTAALAGHLIARAIVEGDDTWRLFLPYELVWAGGRFGRGIFNAAAWWSRRREAMLAHMARRRERRAERRLRAAVGLPEEPPRPAYHVVDAAVMSDPPQRQRSDGPQPAPAATARDTAAPTPAAPTPAAPTPAAPTSVAPAVAEAAQVEAPAGQYPAAETVNGDGAVAPASDANTTAGPQPAASPQTPGQAQAPAPEREMPAPTEPPVAPPPPPGEPPQGAAAPAVPAEQTQGEGRPSSLDTPATQQPAAGPAASDESTAESAPPNIPSLATSDPPSPAVRRDASSEPAAGTAPAVPGSMPPS